MEIHSERKKRLSLSLLFKIIKDTVWGFIDDSVMRLSASLAYATLFSIIPFLSLLVTVGVFFHMDLANQLYVQLQPIVGPEVTEALRSIIENAENTDPSRSAAFVSLGISIFGATTIFAEIQSSLNSIWGIKAVPKKSWLKFIKNRILSFSIILVFAFILLITFTITNIIGELSQKFIFKYPEVADSLVKVVGIIINMSVTTIIFTLIFKILPDAKIKSKDVCINVGTVYGAAAFMVVFVTWIYYSSIIIYTGAEFTKAWANEMGSKIFPDEYAVATKTIEIHEDKPIE